MALQDLIMPKMGESVAEATIIKWTKAVGDSIKQDETVLEIATDKVDSEIPSPFEGVLQEVLFKEGEVVQVGSVIARISNSQTASTSPKKVSTEPVLAAASKASTPETPKPVLAAQASNDSRFYSPLVKSIAKSEQITSEELAQIPGTGHEGRVTKADLIQYLSERLNPDTSQKLPKKPSQALTETITPVSPKKQEVTVQMGDEIIEMDRMRKLIADHMVMSKQVSPHVTSFVEADVTALVKWREKNKTHFEKSYGEKLTFTPLFIESVARAIRDFPMINVSVSGSTIIKRKDINIGMATALPSGNLIVPAIYSNTTASAANVFVSSAGLLQRSTSALKYKQDIRDLESIDINKFRPVRYKSKCANDDQTKDHFGIIADEVDQAGITELVNYGADGEVEGFQYERLTVVLLKAIQELTARVAELEGKIKGFLYFVPWCENRLSLDRMMREKNIDPGVSELLIVDTVEFARENNITHISLNFAAFRSLFERSLGLI